MLFRKEAVEEINNQFSGGVLVIPKIRHSVLISFLLLWVLFVLYWLFTNNYSRKESVLGWVSPSSGVVRVFSPLSAGVVREVYVDDGQAVLEGDLLFLLNNPKTLYGGEDYNVKFNNEIKEIELSLESQKLLPS